MSREFSPFYSRDYKKEEAPRDLFESKPRDYFREDYKPRELYRNVSSNEIRPEIIRERDGPREVPEVKKDLSEEEKIRLAARKKLDERIRQEEMYRE